MTLAEHISIATRYARSANLERDAGVEDVLEGYFLTGRVTEVLDRIITPLQEGTGAAISITGPYGAGKSSLGVFVDALLGPVESVAYEPALDLIRDLAPQLQASIEATRSKLGESGATRAFVTARQEPVTHTVTRALEMAVLQRFGDLPSVETFPEVELLREALADLESKDPARTGPSAGSLLELAIALSADRPLLLLIDEFGKNLEAAQHRADADLYLLQLLAEAALRREGAGLFIVTMQHLAFGDYLAAIDSVQQREWAKVQGRFDDIMFVESAAQSRQLISKVFTLDGSLKQQVQRWARTKATELNELGLFDLANADDIASWYPLDPLTVAVLPDLCRRYGQNERTLFSFLSGSGLRAVPATLQQLETSADFPTIGLPEVYDYFVASSSAIGTGTRWSEIQTRIRDLGGLDEKALRLAKSVGLLNLVSTGGALRASSRILAMIHSDPTVVESLLEQGVLTYRPNTDEYRVWQGTGLDLDNLISERRVELLGKPPAQILNQALSLEPLVASGHSMRTDTLRTFERAFVRADEPLHPLPAGSLADGRLAYVLDGIDGRETVQGGSLPVVAHQGAAADSLLDCAIDRAALEKSLEDSIVAEDWVATSELRERRALSAARLRNEFEKYEQSGTWLLLTDGEPIPLDVASASEAVSRASDIVFERTVPIRNETINRVELTSQGAKARRLLLHAVLQSESEPQLGLEGQGPEVAMYRAVLEYGGLHHFAKGKSSWALGSPKKNEPLYRAWTMLVEQLLNATDRRVGLSEIYARLQLPPYGMKEGVIPVLVVVALTVMQDEVALYEHGTFRPILDDATCDRLVKNPGHFDVKYYASASGARLELVQALAQRLDVSTTSFSARVANVLGVVGRLVGITTTLPEFTTRADLGFKTNAVRDALLGATEPDTLLFESLPDALNYPSFAPGETGREDITSFVADVVSTVEELTQHYESVMSELTSEILEKSGTRSREALAAQAGAIAEGIIDPELRAFVLALSQGAFEQQHWTENVATVLTRTAPKFWRPSNRAHFSLELTNRMGSYHRLQILHHETQTRESDHFTARRLTSTSADGVERAFLVAFEGEELDFLDAGFDLSCETLDLTALQARYPNPVEFERKLAGLLSVREERRQGLNASNVSQLQSSQPRNQDQKANHGE